MPRYEYAIIGGGMTADSAINGIREVDSSGSIGLVGEELEPPYNRPPLSKALWKGAAVDTIWRHTDRPNVGLHLGRRVVAIEPGLKRFVDDQGVEYFYERLLLATGGTPRRLDGAGEGVIYFRSLDDYSRLRALAQSGKSIAVIGGGFIGSEIAAALAMNSVRVSMVFPEDTIGGRVFPRELGSFLNTFYSEKNVEVMSGWTIVSTESVGGRVRIRCTGERGSREMVVDGVVAGLGIVPNVALARDAGLAVEGGIVVDEFTRTSDPSIHAAGDVAVFHSPALGKRIRVEHEDNANTMGRIAGRNMAGSPEPYHHLPSFYSDLFDLGYEAIGELDPRLETVADWKEPNREGVIYYVGGGTVRGVVLWNVWDQVEAARKLIAGRGTYKAHELEGLLPEKR